MEPQVVASIYRNPQVFTAPDGGLLAGTGPGLYIASCYMVFTPDVSPSGDFSLTISWTDPMNSGQTVTETQTQGYGAWLSITKTIWGSGLNWVTAIDGANPYSYYLWISLTRLS